MSVWIKNLLLYCEEGKSGNCPKCQSENVKVIKLVNGQHESVTFECEKCKAFEHFDGALGMEKEKK